jgi:hypothetical protein
LRHPELGSGSIPPQAQVLAAEWMLKQVQHDKVQSEDLKK